MSSLHFVALHPNHPQLLRYFTKPKVAIEKSQGITKVSRVYLLETNFIAIHRTVVEAFGPK